jgi:hypothetical protein
MNAPAKTSMADILAAAAAPLPRFIQAAVIAASLRMYRYRPEQIAEILAAIGDAMQAEHYKHDGELSDYLHDAGEQVTDTGNDLRVIARREEEVAA